MKPRKLFDHQFDAALFGLSLTSWTSLEHRYQHDLKAVEREAKLKLLEEMSENLKTNWRPGHKITVGQVLVALRDESRRLAELKEGEHG